MSKDQSTPPRWLDWIIELYCKPDVLEDLQGDLHEYYARNLKKGRAKANLIFFIDVFKFFRLYTIRKPKILRQMTFFNLIENYFKTSARSLARNKLFSSINIIGLAISMSIGILMITYISELLSYDQFHEKKDRIYRILTSYQGITSDQPIDLASTSVFMGEKLKEDYLGMERVLIMRGGYRSDLSKGENIISVKGLYSKEEFFDFFSFKLLSGDPATALKEPNSIILTKSVADKLFDVENPVGEILKSGENDFTVTGILEDVPSNSHMQFEVLTSFSTIENEQRKDKNSNFFTYRSVWNNYVYMLLEEGKDPSILQANLDQISGAENKNHDRFTINFKSESLLDIVPGKKLSNQISPSVEWSFIYQLIGLTLIVILSACFNYTNLSIARSMRRAKEVGVRKVVGASRIQVFTQFIFEAIIISILALIFAYGLFFILKPEFIHLVLEDDPIGMNLQWIHLVYFLGFAVIIGFLAGVLPSLFLSKLKAISILKDASKLKFFKGVSLRKVLVVFQFAMSMSLIIGATISYQQYNFAINFDLGFTTDNILNVRLKDNDAKLLMTEFEKVPEITNMSQSGIIPSSGMMWGSEVKYKDPMDSVSIAINYVDKKYVDLHEFEFLSGGTFPYDLEDENDPKFIIIDEMLMTRFGFETPENAVGEVLELDASSGTTKVEIVGVIKDYQYNTIEGERGPTALIHGGSDDFRHINLNVNTDDVIGLMSKLENIWSKVDGVHPFEAVFFEDRIQEAYSDYNIMYKIFTFLAFLAISIASMGLLGMAVFTTETRMKEISVRKVMGASERNLVFLLSKGFMWMLVISAAIAIPGTYLLFDSVILVNYVNRIPIGPLELLSGVVLIFFIGLITISWQTLRAAKTNPAQMLRSE